MKNPEKLVEIYLAHGEAEANIIKGLLESYDIPCLLKSLAAPSVHAFAIDGLGEVRVMVRESDAGDARNLVREDNDA